MSRVTCVIQTVRSPDSDSTHSLIDVLDSSPLVPQAHIDLARDGSRAGRDTHTRACLSKSGPSFSRLVHNALFFAKDEPWESGAMGTDLLNSHKQIHYERISKSQHVMLSIGSSK